MGIRSAEHPIYDLLVLGGGTGGLVAAQVAAGIGARVMLVERDRTGGDCLWTGCVPSKTLIAAADLAHDVRQAHTKGLAAKLGPVDLAAVMREVRARIDEIQPHDSPERLEAAGVDVLTGHGVFTADHTLAVGDRTVQFRSAIIATGAAPIVPDLPGMDGPGIYTSDTIWELDELPRRLVVLGGGPVGCELGQAFARLGSEVTVVTRAGGLLPRDEPGAGTLIAERLQAEGSSVLCRHTALGVDRDEAGRSSLRVEGDGNVASLPFDALLVAVGRMPRTTGLGLDRLGITPSGSGALDVNDDLRTTRRHVFAVGDVTARLPFTHVAAHHARTASVNAMFGVSRSVDPIVPWVTFTRPEVAHVGLSLAQARALHGDDVKVARSEMVTLDRAVTDGRREGFSLLIGDRKGRLIGATVVSAAAGEVIAELTARVKAGDRIDVISTVIHAYPTMAEGPARAADDYLRQKFAAPWPRRAARVALALRRVWSRVRRG